MMRSLVWIAHLPGEYLDCKNPLGEFRGDGKPDVATEALFQQKATIRKEILARRESQDPEVRAALSRKIVRALLNRKEFHQADRILIYLSIEGEVDTDELLGRTFELGKRICVPVVDRKRGDLLISELPGPEVRFRKGVFGIREPEADDLNEVSPDSVDLVVVPGLAFDRRGGRIGYGKGYYDRLLSRLGPKVPRIALAFEFQLFDSVPQDESDVRVNVIITEKSAMNCSVNEGV